MSHSIHRQGTEESLRKDFVIISLISKAIKKFWPDKTKRMKKLGEICKKHKPNNYEHKNHIFQGSFDDPEEMKGLLKDLKEADLCMPVILTGNKDEIVKMGREVGLNLNAVHLSLGVFGKKELLPDPKILEMTTMCGHHCISSSLVQKLTQQLKSGKMTMDAAVNQLSDVCTCHIFNQNRARQIFEQLTNTSKNTKESPGADN